MSEPWEGMSHCVFRGTPLQCNWGVKLMVKNGDANISNWQSTYLIDWVSTQCLTYTTNYFHQLTLESWYNNLEQMPPTRCHQYQNLTNDIFTWLYNTNRNFMKLTNDWWQPYQLKVLQPTLSQINWPMCFNRSLITPSRHFLLHFWGCKNASHQNLFLTLT